MIFFSRLNRNTTIRNYVEEHFHPSSGMAIFFFLTYAALHLTGFGNEYMSSEYRLKYF